MIKNFLKISLFIGSFLFAQDPDFKVNTYSLIGFEGGYGSANIDKTSTANSSNKKYNGAFGGIKIGAQSDEYRVFLSARYLGLEQFDTAYTLGGEVQYMFNFASFANFYLGGSGGLLHAEFTPQGESTSRVVSDPYFGGDAGFNIHFSKTFDFEIGARVITSQAKNLKNNITYEFNTISSAYASFIFKYKID